MVIAYLTIVQPYLALNNGNTAYDITGAQWVQVDGDWYGVRLQLPGVGYYYISNAGSILTYRFGALYYGVSVSSSGQSWLPNTAFPLGK